MNLRFWRKNEEPVFDPGAGEIPEHLEIYPPGKPFPWRIVATAVFVGTVSTIGLDAVGAYRDRDAEPGSLLVIEAARLDTVCAEEGRHLKDLYAVAPCDSAAQETLGKSPGSNYYVARTVRINSKGRSSNPNPYLLSAECYAPILTAHEFFEPIEQCVVRRLNQ